MLKSIPAWLSPAPDSRMAEAVQRGKSPWIDAIHLLWSVWVFITPLFGDGYDWRWFWLTLASYPLFVFLYLMTLASSRRASRRYAFGMVALAAALLPVYPSGISYFIFGCIMLRLCHAQTLRRYLGELVLLNAAFWGLAWWIGYPWQMLVWMPPMTFIIGLVVDVERTSQEKDTALKLSHDEVRRLAATAERERIGRDLHDLLGHTLSLITLKLELSRKLFDRDLQAARREVEEAERVARLALAEVRSAVTGIRATDLAAELAAARLLLESSSVRLDYDAPPALPVDIAHGLSLVLREAVTNIVRHARAGRAQITFAHERDAVQVRIDDDGRGGTIVDGNGLSGMRERVAALGGTLRVESSREQGTRLLVCVPLKSRTPLAASATASDVRDDAAHDVATTPGAERLRAV